MWVDGAIFSLFSLNSLLSLLSPNASNDTNASKAPTRSLNLPRIATLSFSEELLTSNISPLYRTDAKPRAEAACRLCRGAKEEEQRSKGIWGIGNINVGGKIFIGGKA